MLYIISPEFPPLFFIIRILRQQLNVCTCVYGESCCWSYITCSL